MKIIIAPHQQQTSLKSWKEFTDNSVSLSLDKLLFIVGMELKTGHEFLFCIDFGTTWSGATGIRGSIGQGSCTSKEAALGWGKSGVVLDKCFVGVDLGTATAVSAGENHGDEDRKNVYCLR